MSPAKKCPIDSVAAKKDGRYPCAGKSAKLLSAGQLILVVFIIEKGVKFDGKNFTEQLIKDKKASWWEPPPLEYQPEEDDTSSICYSAFHDWVKSKGNVVKDVVHKIAFVSNQQFSALPSFNWNDFITQLLPLVKDPLPTQFTSPTAPASSSSVVKVNITSAQLPLAASSSSLPTWLSFLLVI